MATFTIKANEPATLSDPVRGFQAGRKITFEVDGCCVGTVKVPDTMTVDDIKATIQAEADRLAAINDLS